jgi:CubicO group peptidase (beta-lactamase class C family)
MKFITHDSVESIIDDLERVIPEKMDARKVPGLSIAIIKDTKVLWSKGFGVKSACTRSGEPVKADTVFSVGSLSKPVFAYAALNLCEKEILDLDTPLTDYLPEPYLVDEPYLELITVRKILSHTTGFPNRRPKGKRLKILFTPGERFSYSGEGYVYLGKVIEHLTERTLEDFMREELLEPFGMNSSNYVWSDAYELGANAHDVKGIPHGFSKRKTADPAASLYSNVTDYAKFMCEINNKSKKGNFQISEAMTTKMLEPQINVYFSISWGLGWGIQHTKSGDSFWQWGGINVKQGGFRSFAISSKNQGVGVVILTNSVNGLMICEEIITQVLGGEQPVFSDFLNI